MKYSVKEIFETIQGEGVNAGRRAVFLRFSGCNLWSGAANRRGWGAGACAEWCDTDFYKGKLMGLETLVEELGKFPEGGLVVITGGEPCLQLDEALVMALKRRLWEVAIETNGTVWNPALEIADHVCVSPKKGTALVVRRGHELKVVLPGAGLGHAGWSDFELEDLERAGKWGRLYVQPQDPLASPEPGKTALTTGVFSGIEPNTKRCVEFVMSHPSWRVSMQTHKFMGVP